MDRLKDFAAALPSQVLGQSANWPRFLQRLHFPPPSLSVHLLDGPTADLQTLGQFPLAHSLRPLHPDVLPLLLAQAGPPARETPFGPRLRLPRDRALPDRVPPALAEGEHHRELEPTVGHGRVEVLHRDRNSPPTRCRPSITYSPQVSPVSGGDKWTVWAEGPWHLAVESCQPFLGGVVNLRISVSKRLFPSFPLSRESRIR